MNRESLDRFCERSILVLVLAILMLGPLAFGAVEAWSFLTIQAITLVVLLFWGARLWLNPRPQLLWPPICWSVLAFVLYALVRYKTAPIEYIARQEFVQVLVYALLFLAILNNLHRQESTHLIGFCLVFLAMAISIYAAFQFLTNSRYVWFFPAKYSHRGSGTYISPNHLGGFLELVLPLALAFTLAGRLKPVMKVFLGYAAFAILAGVVVTVSRGCWFSTAGALLIFFGILAFHRDYRLPSLAFFTVVLIAALLLLPHSFALQHRLRELFLGPGKINDDLRFALWLPAFRMWQAHPWWGVGPSHFNERFPLFRPEDIQLQPDWSHNDYLNTLADYGLAGAVLVASTWLCLTLGVVKTWRSVWRSQADLGGKPGNNKFAFVVGASLGLVAILGHSLVDFNFHIPANAIIAVTLMALLTGYLRFATERYWFSARLWLRLLASAVILASLVFLVPQGLRRGTEARWLNRARQAPPYSPEEIQCLKNAFACDRANGRTAFRIGEALQVRSREGSDNYPEFNGADYRALATEAMEWLARCQQLNPFSGYAYLHYGACLDWLGKCDQSDPFFDHAQELDPNGFFTMNYVALHYVELGNYAAAKPIFLRSLRMEWADNPVARSWLAIIDRKLLEAAGSAP